MASLSKQAKTEPRPFWQPSVLQSISSVGLKKRRKESQPFRVAVPLHTRTASGCQEGLGISSSQTLLLHGERGGAIADHLPVA